MQAATSHLWCHLPYMARGRCMGPRLLKTKVLVWVIPGDLSITSQSCKETFWIGGTSPPKHWKGWPSREGMYSVEDPLPTPCKATCGQPLFSAKANPVLPQPLLETSGQELQRQVPHRCIFPKSILVLENTPTMCIFIGCPERIFLDTSCLPRDFSTQGILSSCVENQ